MKWVAGLVLLGLLVLYVGVGAFGFVMSAFCFDAGAGAGAWNCFAGINLAAVLPSLLFMAAGVVLLFMRRYRLAIVVAAVPALVLAAGLVVVLAVNAG